MAGSFATGNLGVVTPALSIKVSVLGEATVVGRHPLRIGEKRSKLLFPQPPR